MKRSAIILFFILSITMIGRAQEEASDLSIVPLQFDKNEQPIELDVNFQMPNPATLTRVEITLASDTEKTNAHTITMDSQQYRIWTRGDLNVVICQLDVPTALVGNCQYVEVKIIKNDGTSITLERYAL